jgi:mono/diheme cytochrome c family protein
MARPWMKRLAKIVGYGLLGLVVLLAIAITFTIGWRPFIGAKSRPLTARKFERTPERFARGQYLADGVLSCFLCHSQFDEKADPPVITSKKGVGRVFAEQANFRVVAPNITPDAETGVGNWTDDALARAIREGIAQDGSTLFPIMGYREYRHLSDEDLAAVVVYLRSLEPVHNSLPKTNLPFWLRRLVQVAPQPITAPVPPPDTSDPVKRGEYLSEIAGCGFCHTPRKGMPPHPDMARAFSGGNDFEGVVTPNITPDASGISYYDESLFIEVMRTGQVKARKIKFPMPWPAYRNMTDEDLKAIFSYLRTLKPVHHVVDNTEPPTPCRTCGKKHGFGDRN